LAADPETALRPTPEAARANAATAAFLAPVPPLRDTPSPSQNPIVLLVVAIVVLGIIIGGIVQLASLALPHHDDGNAWLSLPYPRSDPAGETMAKQPERPLILTPPGVEPDPLANPRFHLVPL
jgi:hypothetical protein